MPKKWRNHWPQCTSEVLAENRDSVLLTLGNLAIITQSLNASIRDADWATKKEGKNVHPGLTTCASGIVTLNDALKLDKWDEGDIKNRADALCDVAEKLWKI